jgi:hypothetical protein
MTKKNKFGLSRYINEATSLEIRRRSKFGCVLCRLAICEYEHIDPEFSEAKEHNPENICLLCGTCHSKVTRNRISKETVKRAYKEIQNNNQADRPNDELDLTSPSLTVVMGTCVFESAKSLIEINGETLLKIDPPTETSKFPTISGTFYDEEGIESARIVKNVWETPISVWDANVVGPVVTIMKASRSVSLEFEIHPPSQINIRRLKLYKDNCRLIFDNEGLRVEQLHKNGLYSIKLSQFRCVGAAVGIHVDSRTNNPPSLSGGIAMIGGKGILIEGTGISLGVGSGRMHVMNFQVSRTLNNKTHKFSFDAKEFEQSILATLQNNKN